MKDQGKRKNDQDETEQGRRRGEESGVHACDKIRTKPDRSAEDIPTSHERIVSRLVAEVDARGNMLV